MRSLRLWCTAALGVAALAACTADPAAPAALEGGLDVSLDSEEDGELRLADAVAVAPDGTVAVLVQGAADSGLVQVRDGAVAGGTPLDEHAWAVLPRPDGSFVLPVSEDASTAFAVAVVPPAGQEDEVTVREVQPALGASAERPVTAAISPDGETLYLAFSGGVRRGETAAWLAAVDPDTGALLAQREVAPGSSPVGVAVAPGGQRLVVALETADGGTEVREVDAATLSDAGPPVAVAGAPLTAPAAGPDGALYLLVDRGAATGPELVRVGGGGTEVVVELPDDPYDEVRALAVDPGGDRVVLAGRTGADRMPTVTSVDLADGAVGEPVELAGYGLATAVVATGDEVLVAGTGDDTAGTARAVLWSLS
ncbi:hypothetical protein [Blastococcus sp. SYSU D00820]